ncbi:hypothetical protein [Nocardiopsis halophila]|uniref:hypothetical protein n=1 Tax=Nocardiopsis halophila TaxID=141692 RepID=UPI0012691699|nr:hypothetical protein [Nocardiopsis halophila]
MQKMRNEEAWAQVCMQVALPGVEVSHNDDGRADAVHDFNLFRGGHRFAAVEVTTAADSASLALWKIMNGGGRWIREDLDGGWLVALTSTARAKRIWADLPALLVELERLGAQNLSDLHGYSRHLINRAQRLGVVHAHQSATDYPGSIYITIELPLERSGGMVGDTGDAFARWVGSWLRQPSQADNLSKLQRSGADERHLFLILPGFTVAPFEAYDPLMRPSGPLPAVAPSMPKEITHLWVMSTWNSGDVFFWSPEKGWKRFEKVM